MTDEKTERVDVDRLNEAPHMDIRELAMRFNIPKHLLEDNFSNYSSALHDYRMFVGDAKPAPIPSR